MRCPRRQDRHQSRQMSRLHCIVDNYSTQTFCCGPRVYPGPHKQDAGRFTAPRCDIRLPEVREDRATAAEARCESCCCACPLVHASSGRGAEAVEDPDRSLTHSLRIPSCPMRPTFTIRCGPPRDVAKSPRGQTRVIDDIHFRISGARRGHCTRRVKAETRGTDVGPFTDRIWR